MIIYFQKPPASYEINLSVGVSTKSLPDLNRPRSQLVANRFLQSLGHEDELETFKSMDVSKRVGLHFSVATCPADDGLVKPR